MKSSLAVTSAGLVKASESDHRRGLIGYVTVALNDALLLDGLTLRRTRAGRYALSFPERTDARGKRRAIIRPLSTADLESIESQVFAQLGIRAGEAL